MDDRRVHATTEDGREIVRYDRAGKWYVEAGDHRRQVTFVEAVRLATLAGSTVRSGLSGGRAFDARVTAEVASDEAEQ
jgi:hypothetical protein